MFPGYGGFHPLGTRRQAGPDGTEHVMTRSTARTGTYVHDASADLRGAQLQDTWIIRFDDYGSADPSYWNRDFVVNSWNLKFARSADTYATPICDGTEMESMLVQSYLRTFAIDVG